MVTAEIAEARSVFTWK